uniref:Uncharacterized protein n=1 Tax=Anguilla anguilla TaxID=7936 RepID=A0A0E9WS64_ANGAN
MQSNRRVIVIAMHCLLYSSQISTQLAVNLLTCPLLNRNKEQFLQKPEHTEWLRSLSKQLQAASPPVSKQSQLVAQYLAVCC